MALAILMKCSRAGTSHAAWANVNPIPLTTMLLEQDDNVLRPEHSNFAIRDSRIATTFKTSMLCRFVSMEVLSA
jgi:hypothetical protein